MEEIHDIVTSTNLTTEQKVSAIEKYMHDHYGLLLKNANNDVKRLSKYANNLETQLKSK